MASIDSLHKASIRWCSATSSRYWELSNNRDSIADKIGNSAMTAVVITVLGVSVALPTLRDPPEAGFSPRIQTRCWRVVSTRCQEVPKMVPWQWARLRMARIHWMFFAVSWEREKVCKDSREMYGYIQYIETDTLPYLFKKHIINLTNENHFHEWVQWS